MLSLPAAAQDPGIEALSDKRRFINFARIQRLPVPRTWAPENLSDVAAVSHEARFPVVLKPSHPAAWTSPALQTEIGPRKAWTLQNADELLRAYEIIAAHNTDVLIQECIVGPDDSHYSLHAYLNADSKPLAWFTGRKIRIYPAYAGSGSYVESVYVEPLVSMGLPALENMGYTGIAVINFKQDARTGEFLIHEINPRVSQWNILATRCGVDIPYLAYADTAGIPLPKMPAQQKEHVYYVNLRSDLKALAAYRKRGDWGLVRYAGSLAVPLVKNTLVHQTAALDDLAVLTASLSQTLRSRWAH